MSRLPHGVRLLLAAAVLVANSSPLGAQYVEQIDVAIANVDVVVTDRDGKPVRGLTKDDFTLYENGKAQPITNFSAFDVARETMVTAATGPEPTAPAAPPPVQPRPRLIVLFVDIDEIEPVPRKTFFAGLGQYLDKAMRPGDYLTLLTWTNRVRVILPPVSDRKIVTEAVQALAEANKASEAEMMRRLANNWVEEVKREAAFADSIGQDGPNPEAEAEFQEWFAAEERCALIKRKVKELRNLVVSMARVDLQKVLIFACDDVVLRPTQTCSTMHELDDLADTANAYGLTIHAFHPPGARDKNVPSPELIGPPPGDSPMAAEYRRVFDQSGGLLRLAQRTGGRVGVGPAESAEVFQRAAAELETSYSLGYRLDSGKEDKPRKIKVVTKDRTHRVRTRDSVTRLSETARLRDRVTTNLYLPDETPSASLTFTPKVAALRREGRAVLADVVLSIPASNLMMLRGSDDTLRGSFSVLVAAGRELGDASDVTELKQDFNSKSAPTPESAITYSFSVRIRPDSRRLSIAVRDNLSGEVATKLVMLEK